MPGEVDLGVHLRAVEGALGDEVVPVSPEREDIGGEADAELGGERRRVAHPVHGEPDEDDVGAAVGDELLDRLAVDVVLELFLLDLDADDLLHAFDIHLVGDRGRVLGDDRDRRLLAELLRGGDELERDRADLAPQVLGDDEDAHASFSCTISWMRCATSAAPPFSISAPSPFGGTNILRTRVGRLAELDRPGRTSISFSSACLIARSVA